MANLTFSVQYDMNNPSVWYGAVIDSDPSSLTLETLPHTTVYTNNDGSFRYKSGSLLPVSGKVTGIEQYESGELQYEYSDGNFTISKILGYLKKLDALGLEKYLLSSNDEIHGSDNTDTLLGWNGNDILDGDMGADTLDGGSGSDTASYAASTDAVTVTVNGTGSGGDAEGDILLNIENLLGSDFDDSLTGDAGANRLDGGTGADTLAGKDGNDIYVIDDTGDSISETADKKAGNADLVESLLSDYTLAANLENLTLIGNGNINGTGNELKNQLTGNDANNVLDGSGDLQQDTLSGGKGNDFYIVDLVKSGSSAKLQDKIIEKVDAGNDTLELHAGDLGLIKASTLKLAAHLENLDASHTGNNLLNLTGNGLNNRLTGNAAANSLDGGKGADELIGGGGGDSYIVDHVDDTITELDETGIDHVDIKIATAGGSYTLGANIENAKLTSAVAFNLLGNAGNNILIGNSKNNTLEGKDGEDDLQGGSGNDILIGGQAADTLDGGKGTDTVSYAGSSAGVTITLTGKIASNGQGGDASGDSLINFENVIGSDHADTLTGDAGANLLDGGGGADILNGGAGNDVYGIDTLDDNIVDSDGKDTVQASISYSLVGKDFLENLTLTGNASIDGTGNALDNTIIGNDHANTLNGGEGNDTLKGGKGDDTYVLDLVRSGTGAIIRDSFVENIGEGSDTVVLNAGDLQLTTAFKLVLAANIENMNAEGTGSNKLNLIGNASDNTLIGNAGDNLLDGAGGIDTLRGGAGNDTYIIDDSGDIIIEEEAGGTDEIQIKLAIANATYTLSGNLENATLLSSVDSNLVGNAMANKLTGNAKNNSLEGGDGADILDGGTGSDTVSYAGSDAGVSINLTNNTASGGDADGDTIKNFENIIGSAHADTLIGDNAANLLDGGAGADILNGGNGDDSYVVDNAGDSIEDSAGKDSVQSSITFTLADNLENLTLTGNASINATGNKFNNSITGNESANTLNGGAGNDSLSGGSGDDTLNGDDGDDNLDGGDGTDILVGGKGNDSYKVDLTFKDSQIVLEDSVSENNNEGTDSLILYNDRNITSTTSVLLTLGLNLENMDASEINISLLNLTGNTLDNILIGSANNNVLDGGSGNDTLKGGLGSDTLLGGEGNDKLIGGDGSDILTGGAGADTFHFDTVASGTNQDSITDFAHGEDKITLLQSLFQNAGGSGKLASSEFFAGTSLSDTASQHILFDTSSGKLYYNSDGSGTGKLTLIGIVNTGLNDLSASDISLI